MRKRRLIILAILFILIGLPLLGILTMAVKIGQFFGGQNNEVSTSGVMMGAVAKSGMGMAAGGTTVAPTIVGRPIIQPYPLPPVPVPDQGFVPGDTRTVVKNANLSLVVDDVRNSVNTIFQLAKDTGGLVTSSNIYDNQYQQAGTQANVVLRVPVDKLDDTLAKLRKMANKVLQDSVSAVDETKQQVDLQAQLRNLQATEAQLLVLMKQAKNVNDTLQIQQQLNSIRTEIDQTQNQLTNLNGAAVMSTIYVNLTTQQSSLPPVGPQQNSIIEEIRLALRDMVRLYRAALIQGIRDIILLLPLIVLGAIAWFVWKLKARKS